MPVGTRIFKGVSGISGLATEAYQNHKNKTSTDTNQPEAEASHHHDSSSDSEVDEDESTWALDEASQELSGQAPPPYTETDESTNQTPEQQHAKEKNLAKHFLAQHPSDQSTKQASQFPVPVIIPQRRIRDAQRGFVLAYPPLLEECAGIDQKTFLDFITLFNKTCQGSQVFDVINVASFGVGLVPSITVNMTAAAVQKAAVVGQETQSRAQRNTFLDKINDGFFRPRGLWAMIVTWKPEATGQPILSNHKLNLRSSVSGSNSAPQPGQTHDKKNILATSSGTTEGHIDAGSCAELIYPPIDEAAVSTNQLPDQKRNKLKASQDFLADYMDRRRAADFAGMHPNSAVSVPVSEQAGFNNRWADPNHPSNSGTLMGLVTGGKFDPRARRWGQKAQRRARRRGQELTEEEIRMAEMGRMDRKGNIDEGLGFREKINRRSGNKKRGIRRMIRQDVCYLMIVNYPAADV